VIRQGELYWVDLVEFSGFASAFLHPFVVVQNDLFNRSRIGTVIACSLTSNLERAQAPGNLLLARGEGGLRKSSVVNVSQIYTIDKTDLKKRIGTLSPDKLLEILSGIALLLEPRDIR